MLKSSLASNSEAYRIDSSPLPNDEPRRLINSPNSVRRVQAIVPERTTTEAILTTTSESTVNCRCPNHFTQINRNECKCDCPVGQSRSTDMCIKLKTGIEHFSIIERRQVFKHIPIEWTRFVMKLTTNDYYFFFFFSLLRSSRCILTESCAKPTCAYGEYDVKDGRCPRNTDEALTISSNALNSN